MKKKTVKTTNKRFSRRLPDHVTDAIKASLSKKGKTFNEIFEDVWSYLKERNCTTGGQEMLRLRSYEKLQTLVTRGEADMYTAGRTRLYTKTEATKTEQ